MTRRLVMPSALVALGITGALGLGPSQPPASAAGPGRPGVMALAKARGNYVPSSWGPAVLSARQARQLTERLQLHLPLPSGGNFNGIRWEEAGEVPVAHIGPVLEANARCQWSRAVAQHRRLRLGRKVLDAMAYWPHLRGSGPMVPAELAECFASHRREVRYAQRRGWTPSR